MKNRQARVFLWAALCALAAVVVAAIIWVRSFQNVPTAELMKDLRAGIAVRQIKDPDERFRKYLERRYGPLSDPANRQRVFLDFFDTAHIRALQIIVQHSPADQRQDNIKATADWIAGYRATMTAQERADLRAQLQSDAGQAMLRQATAQYNRQDVYYRGDTVPVISQLLATIHDVQSPR